MESNYWKGIGRTRTSRRTMLRGAGLAGAGLFGAALIGCSGDDTEDTPSGSATAASTGTGTSITPTASSEQAKPGGTFRDSEAGDPTSLDPMASGSVTTKTLAAYVYSRLMRIDTAEGVDPFDQGVTPDVAESVESEDGQNWTVKLRQGVKFHNIEPVSGREMTSEDVVFSFNRLAAPESPNSTQVSNIESVEATDDYTVNFKLKAPSPEFLEQLADANLLHIQPKEVDGGFDPALQPIGTGPWILDEFVSSSRIGYLKHPEYFVEGIPYMEAIDVAIIPEDANVLAQFESGNLDQALVPAEQLLDYRERHPDFSWLPGTGNGMAWIAFSGKEVSPDAIWRDPRFRQAISMLLDRDGLLDFAANSKELLAAGFDSPILTRWNNIPEPCAFGPTYWLDPTSEGQGDTAKFFQHNVAEAKKLLDAMGYAGEEIKYQYTNRYSDVFVTLAEAAGNMLSEGGVKLATEVQDYSAVYITNTFKGDFQGIAYGLESTLTPGGYAERLFGQDSSNHGRVHEAEMEELVQAQGREMDPDARTQIFYDMARKQAEQMYYIPAQSSSTTQWSGFSERVRGLRRTRGYGSGTEVYAYMWLNS